MKKIRTTIILLAALLPLTSCEKLDGIDGMVEIFAESMSGTSKVLLVSDTDAIWADGDQILLNGTTATVERRDGHAYISRDGLASTNRALYPASLNVYYWGTDNPSIELPTSYHYRTDNTGKQILEIPMVAYSTGDNPLRFKHLTGALCITVTNTTSSPRLLQAVTISSDKYKLNGYNRIDITNIESLEPATGAVSQRSVTLYFDSECIIPANGGSKKVMIPILPVGSDNHFTISVKTYQEGESTSLVTTKSQTTNTDHSLGRNVLGYAPMEISQEGTSEAVLSYNNSAYEVNSGTEFLLMVRAIEENWYGDKTFKLTADIDMTGISMTPILSDSFTGTIDGDNHTVQNLTIDGIEMNGSVYCALFKSINTDMKIQNIIFNNLRLVNENVGSSTLYVGAIEANNSHSSNSARTISNCSVNIGYFDDGGATGSVFFGGLIGQIDEAPFTLSNCHVTIPDIEFSCSNIWFGGLVGHTGTKDAIIESSTWDGIVGFNNVSNVCFGGFIGYKSMGLFRTTDGGVSGSVSASATGSNRRFGNLVGQFNNAARADVSGTTANISFSLNNSAFTPGNFGVNR